MFGFSNNILRNEDHHENFYKKKLYSSMGSFAPCWLEYGLGHSNIICSNV